MVKHVGKPGVRTCDALTSRTAVYGPVRTVVWEGRSRKAPPYPDCAEHVQQPGGESPLPNLMEVKG